MRTLLTGGTGFIGSAVLDALVDAGHDVHAIVRTDRAAAQAAERGAVPLHLDVTDVDAFAAALDGFDAAVHAASPAEGADRFNAAVLEAVERAFADGRRFVLTSGVWVYGDNSDIREDAELDAPELVAWRVPQEERLLASSVDTRIVVPGVVYGHGRGLVGLITDGPRTADGALRLIGEGDQRWTLVHVDDLARLYRAALEHDGPLGRVIASDGSPTPVRAIAEAVAGESGVEPETTDATRERLGTAFADALLLDQAASGDFARWALGWVPEHVNVLDEVSRAQARSRAA